MACSLPMVNNSKLNILDLCCGSGILGIEAALKLKEIDQIEFLELQEEFLFHLVENLKNTELESIANISIGSIGNARYEAEKFDYILCNPPYFKKGEGRRSPNEKKQLCRTFEINDLDKVFEKAEEWLKQSGYLCLSLRDEQEVEKYLDRFKIIKKEKFSETFLISLSRLNVDRC